MNILFVENHSVFASNTNRMFLAAHQVTVVPSLAGARRALSAKHYDLILIDFDLDDGKGDELVREVSASINPVVMVAVSSHEAGNAALLKAGAKAVCDKMHFDQIQNVIEAVFQSRHA